MSKAGCKKAEIGKEDRQALQAIQFVSVFMDLYGEHLRYASYGGSTEKDICDAACKILEDAHNRLYDTLSGMDPRTFDET